MDALWECKKYIAQNPPFPFCSYKKQRHIKQKSTGSGLITFRYDWAFTNYNSIEIYMVIIVIVDIFACTNFRGFMKLGNFACIKIRVLCKIGSIGYYKSNFRGIHIFADI